MSSATLLYRERSFSYTVRRYEKDLSRYNKVALDITFLQECRLFHIYPKFLDFKLSREDQNGNEITNQTTKNEKRQHPGLKWYISNNLSGPNTTYATSCL